MEISFIIAILFSMSSTALKLEKNSLYPNSFMKEVSKLALPLVAQEILFALLNMLDMLMIGQLGENAVAAVGISNQFFFVMFILLVGIGSGGAVFTAQYWGAKDIKGIRKIMGMILFAAGITGVIFTTLCLLVPHKLIGLFTQEVAVSSLATPYMRITAISYIPTLLSASYSFVLRSMQEVKKPFLTSVISLSINAVLNYLLIFGKFGFPRLGVVGAAIGTTVARFVELALLMYFAHRKSPLGPLKGCLKLPEASFLPKFLKISAPVLIAEAGWGLANFVYNYVYSHMGTGPFAAMSIFGSLGHLSFVLFFSLGSASSIMTGNLIGGDEPERAERFAGHYIKLTLVSALIIGGALAVLAQPILFLYKMSEEGERYLRLILISHAFVLWIKAECLLMINGVFRGGGDTKFAAYAEVCMMWFLGVPLLFFGWKVLNLPIHLLYLFVSIEEVAKFLLCFYRYKTGKWKVKVTE